jgi:hypothetical protein
LEHYISGQTPPKRRDRTSQLLSCLRLLDSLSLQIMVKGLPLILFVPLFYRHFLHPYMFPLASFMMWLGLSLGLSRFGANWHLLGLAESSILISSVYTRKDCYNKRDSQLTMRTSLDACMGWKVRFWTI